jgi:hypothetical protein
MKLGVVSVALEGPLQAQPFRIASCHFNTQLQELCLNVVSGITPTRSEIDLPPCHFRSHERGLMSEMYKNPSEVFVVLLQPMVVPLYFRSEQESDDTFFQLPRSLPGDNFNQGNLPLPGFVQNPPEFGINHQALIVHIM